MRRSRDKLLVEKSLDACLAALEIYNKPNFRYREEAFPILMLNAWELLLKARVIQHNNGMLRAIEIWEPRINKDGGKSKRQQKKLNRSGNPITIGIDRAAALVRNYGSNGIDQHCVENLSLLREIRDNSVHLHNVSAGLGKRMQEVGSAALKNFVAATEKWFGVDLDHYNFYLMPLAFHSPSEVIESLRSDKHPKAVRKLLDCIAEAERDNPSDQSATFNVTMQVQFKFVRTSGDEALPVRITRDDPDAVAVTVTEDDIRKHFPWDYAELTQSLKSRYADFLQNNTYHAVRKPLEDDERFCRVRYLDPSKPSKGSRKRFYSPGILREFDQHYTKK